jgi:hypothetical protein
MTTVMGQDDNRDGSSDDNDATTMTVTTRQQGRQLPTATPHHTTPCHATRRDIATTATATATQCDYATTATTAIATG